MRLQLVQLKAALWLAVGFGIVECVSADDQLPPPPSAQEATVEFPAEIRLFGYIQRAGMTTVLIEVGSEPLILTKGVEQVLDSGNSAKAPRIMFEDIDLINQSIRIGFPKSPYLPKTCRLKKAVTR